jgi:hypothetical protein
MSRWSFRVFHSPPLSQPSFCLSVFAEVRSHYFEMLHCIIWSRNFKFSHLPAVEHFLKRYTLCSSKFKKVNIHIFEYCRECSKTRNGPDSKRVSLECADPASVASSRTKLAKKATSGPGRIVRLDGYNLAMC